MTKNLPYRAGVGIMLLNKNGEVFVGKRIDTKAEAWQMPQGGIDDGEEPLTAAMREMLEEIGTNKADLLAESANWYAYDLPADLVPNMWSGKFRGQRQKWFLFQFTGDDADVVHAYLIAILWQCAKLRDDPAGNRLTACRAQGQAALAVD